MTLDGTSSEQGAGGPAWDSHGHQGTSFQVVYDQLATTMEAQAEQRDKDKYPRLQLAVGAIHYLRELFCALKYKRALCAPTHGATAMARLCRQNPEQPIEEERAAQTQLSRIKFHVMECKEIP